MTFEDVKVKTPEQMAQDKQGVLKALKAHIEEASKRCDFTDTLMLALWLIDSYDPKKPLTKGLLIDLLTEDFFNE